MDRPWYQKLFSRSPKPVPQQIRLRADAGDAEAQFALGLHYSLAESRNHDFAQALRWYRQAADQNHPLAQFNLGVMFALGQGVPQDDNAAESWIRRGAEGGDAGAQFDLGTRCHRASLNGLKSNRSESRIESYKWFRLASEQGYKDSMASCESMNISMSNEELNEGNRRADDFGAAKERAA